MLIKNKKILALIIIISIAVLAFLAYWIFFQNQEENLTTQQDQNNQQIEDVTEDQSDPKKEQSADNRTDTKTSNVNLDEAPKVYTSSGHVADRPIKNGQLVLTSCTSIPEVSCRITFTSSDDDIVFDPKTTDSQGVADWEWTAGKEIGSGKWTVQAIVGNSTSSKETIYIE